MKAAVCYEFGKPLVVEDVSLDPPQRQEVRVKLAACAICHSDIHSIEGAWGGWLPVVYGHEAAGIVVETGPDVTAINEEDRVVVSLIRSCGRCYFCANGSPILCEARFALDKEPRLHLLDGTAIRMGIKTGAFAEEVVVHQSQLAILPQDFSLELASLLACGVITGFGAVVNTAQVRPGDSVIIVGAGGVGLNSVQGARLSGADPIIAIDLLPNKLQAAAQFGATHTINAAEVEDIVAEIRALTGGRGADYVFVTVGSGAAMAQGLKMIRRGGTLVIVGMPPAGVKVALEAVDFAYDGQRVLGSNMGASRLSKDIPYLVSLYKGGRLKLDELITGRYPLEQINEAIDSVNRGKALRNIIVFNDKHT